MRVALLSFLLIAAAPPSTRSVLVGLTGHSKADVIARLGPPTDTQTTVDGERLTYEQLDASRAYGGVSGGNTRAGGPYDGPLSPRIASFKCNTILVFRDGVLQAFDRVGNGCQR